MDEEKKQTNYTSEEAKTAPKTEVKQESPKKRKKGGLIISIIIIILAIIGGSIGGFIYVNSISKTEIDLSKYVSFEPNGYEGSASFDENDLVIDEKGLKKLLDDKKLASKLVKKLTDKVTVKENENLKNGDTVEVKFKVSEDWLKENKIKLASNSVKIKIKDLKEPSSLDLFEDLEFTYSGISPNLTVSLENNSSDDFIKYDVTFQLEKVGDKNSSSYYSLYNIANGDKIKVTASFDKDDSEKAGYNISEDEYTFTVEDQAEYINDSKDITSDIKKTLEEKMLNKAKSIANDSNYDLTSAYHEDFSDISHYDYNLSHSDPELQKMYIAVNNDIENAGWLDSKNVVYAVYKVVFTDSTTSKTYDLYIAVEVEDVVADKDGLYTDTTYYYDEFYNYNYTSSDGNDYHKSLDELYKSIENSLENNYTITEVK